MRENWRWYFSGYFQNFVLLNLPQTKHSFDLCTIWVLTSSNILFGCSFKVFMKTDCVGVRSCWYIVKNWLKNSIFSYIRSRGVLYCFCCCSRFPLLPWQQKSLWSLLHHHKCLWESCSYIGRPFFSKMRPSSSHRFILCVW